MKSTEEKYCWVCGGTQFQSAQILWPGLIAEWQLAPDEVEAINRQQGTTCSTCHSNLRSIALAKSILRYFGQAGVLKDFVVSEPAFGLQVLEINRAGDLTTLSRMPGHRLACYPEFDMQNLKFPDESFDLIVHSDTLEHIPEPVRALAECRRVMRRGGACCFTVPMVPGRMTRSRAGLPPSYHGAAGALLDDHLVWTEYGCDVWTQVCRAGFESCALESYEFPSALAITAK